MKEYINSKQEEMLELLEKVVNIDSGSYVDDGSNKVGAILQEIYEDEGFFVKVYTEGEFGNHYQIQATETADPSVLIAGHLDTVFPEGTVENRPFTRDENHAYGPGVSDMKGGIVSALYALKALKRSGGDAYKNVQVLMTSDEEIGSPTSRALIEEAAKGKSAALIVEPARGEKDYIVSNRKAVGRYDLKITGQAAHSGTNPENGISAIHELARKIDKIEALNDLDSGISVNVGIIKGGATVNTIPPSAECSIDVRVPTMEAANKIEAALNKIAATSDIEGTKIQLSGEINRPPMIKDEQASALLKIIQEEGAKIGIEIEAISTGGGSDGSFTSAVGTPTIDGMGPAGGNTHTDKEFMKISTLCERTLLLANTIKRLSI